MFGHCLGGGLQIALAADFRFTTADAAWSVSAQSRPPASALAESSSSLQLWTEGSGWHTLASGAPTRFAALVPALDGATPVTWVLWLAPDGSLRAHRAP